MSGGFLSGDFLSCHPALTNQLMVDRVNHSKCINLGFSKVPHLIYHWC